MGWKLWIQMMERGVRATLAGAKFKANAKRTKNRIVSSAPLLVVSAAAHGAESVPEMDRRERFREFGRELPNARGGWGCKGRGDDVRFSKSRAFAVLRSRVSSLPSLAAVAKKKGTPAQGKASAIEEDADADNAGLHDIPRGCRRVVIIGVHGWCPNSEYAWRGKLFSLSIYIS